MAKETFKSRVYTDRPAYADFDAPAKFQAIQGIIATRLKQHPNVVKAAWNIFGKSYEYRAKYNTYKADRMAAEKKKCDQQEYMQEVLK